MEVYDFLNNIEKSITTMDEPVKTGIQRQIIEMKDLLNMERNEYEVVPSYFSSVSFVSSFSVFSSLFVDFAVMFFCLAGFASTSYKGECSFHEIN